MKSNWFIGDGPADLSRLDVWDGRTYEHDHMPAREWVKDAVEKHRAAEYQPLLEPMPPFTFADLLIVATGVFAAALIVGIGVTM